MTGAAKLFTERGFRQTSVKDVADRIEMTRAPWASRSRHWMRHRAPGRPRTGGYPLSRSPAHWWCTSSSRHFAAPARGGDREQRGRVPLVRDLIAAGSETGQDISGG
ncbi:TetR family transcriptional regulator [Streptomyces poonensis]|uniref:TetR family transcriptional regulator n=1 Tax=Streptomyces poonensis TaxID=68255 RepID=UPI00167712A8